MMEEVRLGVIVPSVNTVVENRYPKIVPDGVSVRLSALPGQHNVSERRVGRHPRFPHGERRLSVSFHRWPTPRGGADLPVGKAAGTSSHPISPGSPGGRWIRTSAPAKLDREH